MTNDVARRICQRDRRIILESLHRYRGQLIAELEHTEPGVVHRAAEDILAEVYEMLLMLEPPQEADDGMENRNGTPEHDVQSPVPGLRLVPEAQEGCVGEG